MLLEIRLFKKYSNFISVIFSRSVLLLAFLMTTSYAAEVDLTNDSQREAGQADSLNVVSLNKGIRLDLVNANADYAVVEDRDEKGQVIQFFQRNVVGWVSEDHLTFDAQSNLVTVRVPVLNFRNAPSLDSTIITQVYSGYQSDELARENGFRKILAPASLKVVVQSKESTSGQIAVSDSLGGNASSQNRSSLNTTQDSSRASSLKEEAFKKSKVEDKEIVTNVSSSSPPDGELTHRLAAGDSISLLVFGEPDLSVQNVRVPQGGQVSFPLIGSVSVLGKTTSEVERQVSLILSKGYVRNPRLSVSIFSYRPIFIRGEVGAEGSFPYSEGLTIAKAIALAGGLKDTASTNGVSVLRDGNSVFENLSTNSQQPVASGDIVTVEADQFEKKADSAFIFLHGEVLNSGAYEFKQGLTVEKAVVLAGGFSLRASKKKISISRYEDADETGAPKLLKRVKLHEAIKPGDVIKVGASWF